MYSIGDINTILFLSLILSISLNLNLIFHKENKKMYISIIYLKIAIKIEVKLIFFSSTKYANSAPCQCAIFLELVNSIIVWVAASNMQIYVSHLLFLSV